MCGASSPDRPLIANSFAYVQRSMTARVNSYHNKQLIRRIKPEPIERTGREYRTLHPGYPA